MVKVTNVSGGMSSAMIASEYHSDHLVFSLVRIERPDEKENRFDCRWVKGKDEPTRKIIEDRIGTDFYGTAEDDMIIYTILDLEQYLGKEIKIVTGNTFDHVLKYDGRCMPDPLRRYCTEKLKIEPVFNWWLKDVGEPCIFNIGYRKGEESRIIKSQKKHNDNGFLEFHHVIGKSKTGKTNKWAWTQWQRQEYPLANDGIRKIDVENYWSDKPVRFAEKNNCAHCFVQDIYYAAWRARNNENVKEVMKWAATKDRVRHKKDVWFKEKGIGFKEILESSEQSNMLEQLDSSDFNDCDTGYCGV